MTTAKNAVFIGFYWVKFLPPPKQGKPYPLPNNPENQNFEKK